MTNCVRKRQQQKDTPYPCPRKDIHTCRKETTSQSDTVSQRATGYRAVAGTQPSLYPSSLTSVLLAAYPSAVNRKATQEQLTKDTRQAGGQESDKCALCRVAAGVAQGERRDMWCRESGLGSQCLSSAKCTTAHSDRQVEMTSIFTQFLTGPKNKCPKGVHAVPRWERVKPNTRGCSPPPCFPLSLSLSTLANSINMFMRK